MANRRGHIEIDGQSYLVQDESYKARVVPMFRPQLVVEGISREAQDQYLYMAQDTWDRGSYFQARNTLRWQNGGFGRIDGIDNSIENRIQLQRLTEVSKAFPMVDALGKMFSYNGSTFTDHTTEAASAGGTPFVLFPDNDFSDDIAYFGLSVTFQTLRFGMATDGGDGTVVPVIVWEYWDSTQWTAFTPDIETTRGLTTSGRVSWPALADWDTTAINSQTLYWIRARQSGAVTPEATINFVVRDPDLVPCRLVSFAGWLLAFRENGEVWRLGRPEDGWEQVDYDYSTYGAVTFCDIATTGGGGTLVGNAGGTTSEAGVRLLIGTKTGKGFYARATDDGAGDLDITPIESRTFGSTPILAMLPYRDHVAVMIGNKTIFVRVTGDGNWADTVTYELNAPGAAVCMAIWHQLVMLGIQTSTRGSLIMASDTAQAIDNYRVDGGFAIQSICTWGGNLVYAGKTLKTSEVFNFPGTLADRVPPGFAPADIMALMATHRHVLVGWNGHGGLWWIHDKGSGAYAQYDVAHPTSPGIHRRVRSIAPHRGEFYYTLDDIGVIRAKVEEYRGSGEITSNWFDGGFPELTKNFADVFIRLQLPRKEQETVTVFGRVDGQAYVSIGVMAQGRVDSTFRLPASLQQGRRIDLKIVLTSGDDEEGNVSTTPVVTALVLRYRPIPYQQRVWGFTVRAGDNIIFLDQTRERRTPDQIITDLFALTNAGQVDFSTILETASRKVYVTNVEMSPPLIGRSSPERPSQEEETFVAIEVLEAAAQQDNEEVTPSQVDPEDLPLEDPDRGPGDDLPSPGPGAAPPGEDEHQVPDVFSQP